MAFIAAFDSLCFWSDLMSHRNTVIDFSMTLNAPYICYMHCLVREPVMLLDQVYLSAVCKKLKIVKVGVTIETNSIIISYGLLKISAVSDTYLVAVRIMAFPAGKSVLLKLKVSAFPIFTVDLFKVILCEFLISSMAVKTN